jgi:hypothetical protein
MSIQWNAVDTATCPGQEATINGHSVFVSTFDEGPLSPAYYWQIDGKRGVHDGVWFDGWAPSVGWAKFDAMRAARAMERA